MEWEEVPRDIRMKNVTLQKDGIYQFAVAANSKRLSSGMVWATCTILHDKGSHLYAKANVICLFHRIMYYLLFSVVGKLKTVSIDVADKDALKVRWRLDCSDRVGIVTGYKISYCEVQDPSESAPCFGREEQVEAAPDAEKLWVTGLKPWTYYKVGVAVLTRAGESEMSDFLVNRTERDRPGSPPTELEVLLAGRNGADLRWGPPDAPNAPIEFYEVRRSLTNFRGQEEVSVERATGMSAFIRDLMFNAEYTVAVRACTKFPGLYEAVCGKDWAEATLLTGIGSKFRTLGSLASFASLTMFSLTA